MSYHDVIREGCNRHLNDARWRRLCEREFEADPSLEIPQYLLDCFHQPSRLDQLQYWEISLLLQIRTMWRAGDLLYAMIPLRSAPFRNKQVAKINAVLAEIPSPFSASFVSRVDNDGLLGWADPIQMEHPASRTTKRCKAWSATLEVGSTRVSTTWLHLNTRSGAIARWPYRHHAIHLIVNQYPLCLRAFTPRSKASRRLDTRANRPRNVFI